MTSVKSSLETSFGSAYANALGALPGANESWVDSIRQTSRAIVESGGFPGPKTEAWKYTSLREIAKTSFIPASEADDVDVSAAPVGSPVLEGALQVVFVNGVYRQDLSTSFKGVQSGVTLGPLADVLKNNPEHLKDVLASAAIPGESFVAALNTGFMEQGIYLHVEADVEMSRPIQVVSIGASGAKPGAFHPRLQFVLDQNAKATVLETHVGLPGQPYLSNPVTEAILGPGSTLKHYTLVCEDSDAYHLGRSAVCVSEGAQYESFLLSLGGKLARREVQVRLEAVGASAIVDGAYGLSGSDHSDISSEILHLAPETISKQTVKGVLGGKSKGVFQGRVHVAREGQRSDGRQLHKAMLLNRGPEVDCKPELEIYADDVQCAHGATTGEMDSEHIFYLLSRGIDEQTARAMLVEGFLDDVIFDISDDAVRTLVLDMVKRWLVRQSALIAEGV
ncbi:MAG: Fe-S cluster assembly protein SufD [Rhodospirillaceae bacterium]